MWFHLQVLVGVIGVVARWVSEEPETGFVVDRCVGLPPFSM